MSHFDPTALKEAPTKAINDFANDTPAPAVLIQIERGKLPVREAVGTVEINGTQAASTQNSFEVGSQTKMMTSVVVQQLVAERKIDFDAPLADQMDLSGLEGIPNIDVVTVRELLENRSGIPDFDTVPGQTGLPAYIEQLTANPLALMACLRLRQGNWHLLPPAPHMNIRTPTTCCWAVLHRSAATRNAP